jgi:hypothetical protein
MRLEFLDFTFASHYFCNLVEEHARPTHGDAKIRAILGPDYDLKYRNMLRYIPPEQFLEVDSECLGEGQNGAVFGAILKRPKPVLCAMQAYETPFDGRGLPVVLKRIKPGNPSRSHNILREVSARFDEQVIPHANLYLEGGHDLHGGRRVIHQLRETCRNHGLGS